MTVILAGRPKQSGGCEFPRPGTLAIGLESQTRSQTEVFLTTKLTAAGRDLPVFTLRAITRLHCLSAGVPRAHRATCPALYDGGGRRGSRGDSARARRLDRPFEETMRSGTGWRANRGTAGGKPGRARFKRGVRDSIKEQGNGTTCRTKRGAFSPQ